MKKTVVIPEASVEVETKYYVTGFSSAEYTYREQSPVYDTYEEAMAWIANQLNSTTGNRTFEIKAVHGRFAENG